MRAQLSSIAELKRMPPRSEQNRAAWCIWSFCKRTFRLRAYSALVAAVPPIRWNLAQNTVMASQAMSCSSTTTGPHLAAQLSSRSIRPLSEML